MTRILGLDIEATPVIGATYTVRKAFIGENAVVRDEEISMVSVQWYDDWQAGRPGKVIVGGVGPRTNVARQRAMLVKVRDLMNEADVILTYNGNGFDIPYLVGQFIRYDVTPPSPSKSIDLFQMAKKLRWHRKSLDAMTKLYTPEHRKQHIPLFDLTLDIMGLTGKTAAERAESLATIVAYNANDVDVMWPLWEKMRPYIPGLHLGLIGHGRDSMTCPACAGTDLQRRGLARTTVLTYQRWQCKDCGAWTRSAIGDSEEHGTRVLR